MDSWIPSYLHDSVPYFTTPPSSISSSGTDPALHAKEAALLTADALAKHTLSYQSEVPGQIITYIEPFSREEVEIQETASRETDPQETTKLWNLVQQEQRRPTSLPKRTASSDSMNMPMKERQESGVGSSRVTSSGVTSSGVSGSKRNSPYNKDFDENVLTPRSIVILDELHGILAFDHFEVNGPEHDGQCVSHYTNERGAAKSLVWVEVEESFILKVNQNYQRMESRKMCEAEFALYAKEELLKKDDFLLDEPNKREWKTERMAELVARPGKGSDQKWEAPPILKPCDSTTMLSSNYSFDLRPDCAYWLSLRAFNPKYKSAVRIWSYVAQDAITSPYVTVEFKKDDHSERRAFSQVAAASAVAIYNRYSLRKKRLELQEKPWTDKLTKVLRHYGLTMRGSRYTVWVTLPKFDDYEWAGCGMSKLLEGDCKDYYDVVNLIHWINEIHCWGLTKHAPRVAKDVKYCIGSQGGRTGQRVSNIERDSEDDPDSEED